MFIIEIISVLTAVFWSQTYNRILGAAVKEIHSTPSTQSAIIISCKRSCVCQLHTANSSSLLVILQQNSLQSPMSWWRYSGSTLSSSRATGKLFFPTYPVVLSSLRMHNVFLSRFCRLHCLLQAKNGLNLLCEHCIDILVVSQSLVKYISFFSSANNITASSDLTLAVFCAGCRDILHTSQICVLLVSLNTWTSVSEFRKQDGWHKELCGQSSSNGWQQEGCEWAQGPDQEARSKPSLFPTHQNAELKVWIFSSDWGKAGVPSQDKMLAGPSKVRGSSWEMFGGFSSERSFWYLVPLH